jgi:hypothetical protein
VTDSGRTGIDSTVIHETELYDVGLVNYRYSNSEADEVQNEQMDNVWHISNYIQQIVTVLYMPRTKNCKTLTAQRPVTTG